MNEQSPNAAPLPDQPSPYTRPGYRPIVEGSMEDAAEIQPGGGIETLEDAPEKQGRKLVLWEPVQQWLRKQAGLVDAEDPQTISNTQVSSPNSPQTADMFAGLPPNEDKGNASPLPEEQLLSLPRPPMPLGGDTLGLTSKHMPEAAKRLAAGLALGALVLIQMTARGMANAHHHFENQATAYDVPPDSPLQSEYGDINNRIWVDAAGRFMVPKIYKPAPSTHLEKDKDPGYKPKELERAIQMIEKNGGLLPPEIYKLPRKLQQDAVQRYMAEHPPITAQRRRTEAIVIQEPGGSVILPSPLPDQHHSMMEQEQNDDTIPPVRTRSPNIASQAGSAYWNEELPEPGNNAQDEDADAEKIYQRAYDDSLNIAVLMAQRDSGARPISQNMNPSSFLDQDEELFTDLKLYAKLLGAADDDSAIAKVSKDFNRLLQEHLANRDVHNEGMANTSGPAIEEADAGTAVNQPPDNSNWPNNRSWYRKVEDKQNPTGEH